ncbi:hypothetical protein ABIE41_003053 [Bosea sp. OAE506]|uniref:hypothetical protein n=1 Tax=Bosea sp. OAE506 TaxID=2663870 RepID=UPI0033990C07
MSEAAAGRDALTAAAGTPRLALWLAAYLALQALVVGLCLMLAALPAPEPPARYALTQARLEPAAVAVTLPHHLDVRFTMVDPPLFRLAFERPGPASEGGGLVGDAAPLYQWRRAGGQWRRDPRQPPQSGGQPA